MRKSKIKKSGQLWLISKKDTEEENNIYILLRLEKTRSPLTTCWFVLHEGLEKCWSERTMVNDILIVDS